MFKNTVKRSFIISLALLQVVFFPHVGFAVKKSATTPAASSSTTTTGPESPTGADGNTFVFNDKTGLWENDYYTWDPVTKQTAPKGTQDYSYNPDTKRWDTTDWRYDAPTEKYIPNVVETVTPPAGAKISGETPASNAQQLSKVSDDTPSGPGNTISNTTNNNGNYDLFYNASISNKVKSTSQTGDASVINNTTGGSALSGNALTQATVLNLLQSVWDPSNGDIATFTANIDGDVTGDLTIDPDQIPHNISSASNSNNNLTVNASEDTSINNKIDLSAGSGNASVDHNTSGGDASTGTAAAVANVVNLINSVIGSGQSFVGTININGNLNGDILLPPAMLDQLLASNVPRATIDTSNIQNANLLAQFNNKQAITNNVSTDAASGSANVSNNSSAGSATTGSATNNITILNLTGRQIIGSNAMLVFVNVMGRWVGMIMDAPGATSAAVGGGITSNTVENQNASLKSDSTQEINNDISLAAHTGNANVKDNTKAGNATSGNASTSANIANVANSHLSLGGWFGVLFINVFGSWLGSFGVNTSAGDKPAAPATNSTPDVKVFQFIPTASGAVTLASVPTTGNIGTSVTAPTDDGSVLGASTVAPVYGGTTFQAPDNVKVYLGLAIFTMLMMAAGKLLAFLRARKTAGI
ncbi:hypothetical protein BH10PAT3_BH10PAT3_7030 [soil metagenome]